MEHRSLELPKGDVLLHCGDFSNEGTLEARTRHVEASNFDILYI